MVHLPRRQSDVSYGRTDVHFVCSPRRAAAGERTSVPDGSDWVVVATPAQAIVDEVRFLPGRLDWLTTCRLLADSMERLPS